MVSKDVMTEVKLFEIIITLSVSTPGKLKILLDRGE